MLSLCILKNPLYCAISACSAFFIIKFCGKLFHLEEICQRVGQASSHVECALTQREGLQQLKRARQLQFFQHDSLERELKMEILSYYLLFPVKYYYPSKPAESYVFHTNYTI